MSGIILFYGNAASVELDVSATIGDLRKATNTKFHAIFFQGERVTASDDTTLADLGICSESTIHFEVSEVIITKYLLEYVKDARGEEDEVERFYMLKDDEGRFLPKREESTSYDFLARVIMPRMLNTDNIEDFKMLIESGVFDEELLKHFSCLIMEIPWRYWGKNLDTFRYVVSSFKDMIEPNISRWNIEGAFRIPQNASRVEILAEEGYRIPARQ